MNRPIKFKVWHKESKEMGPQTWTPEELMVAAIRTGHIMTMEDFVWLQFTGLLDKNGKEIYEGDIIAIPSFEHGRELKSIRWDNDYADWRAYDLTTHTYLRLGEFANHLIEIIGNIYENPKLLK